VYRKVQEAGLQQRYQADADFSLAVKMLPAIAFCPVADVVDAFETLSLRNHITSKYLCQLNMMR
jgi:hypothetical protein